MALYVASSEAPNDFVLVRDLAADTDDEYVERELAVAESVAVADLDFAEAEPVALAVADEELEFGCRRRCCEPREPRGNSSSLREQRGGKQFILGGEATQWEHNTIGSA